MRKPRSFRLIRSKRAFFATLFVATATVLAVWFVGLRQDWSLFKDSLISISILSVSLFSFLTIGLFLGVKLQDTLGNVTDHIRKFPFADNVPDFGFGSGTGKSGGSDGGGHVEGHGDGCSHDIGDIFLWVMVALLVVVLFWAAAAVVWATFLTCTAVLYWLFFRALRFVFRHSATCRGNFSRSLRYGLTYTTLYVSWLYAIILAVHYLR
ncbi:hypothetical protein [Hymenobacter lucidus]|uniref:Uncharacterized protein n=1 Tax=Hymenobacter lucidus TaxID=2880930 RepID=A0ABS8AWA4_9BACT|nr:hypothetical protein [Hymenobacter lucidus]MCB2409866.1 hypothetical protein [Hymenobacter lucidus]